MKVVRLAIVLIHEILNIESLFWIKDSYLIGNIAYSLKYLKSIFENKMVNLVGNIAYFKIFVIKLIHSSAFVCVSFS